MERDKFCREACPLVRLKVMIAHKFYNLLFSILLRAGRLLDVQSDHSCTMC